MNAVDILKYGHLTFTHSFNGVPDDDWTTGGVCGLWSVKDLVGHLGAWEYVLDDVLGSFLGGTPGPIGAQLAQVGTAKFNDLQAEARKDHSKADILAEYEAAHAHVMALAAQITPEKWREVGTIPWYGPEYALDDFVVYAFYGHKREHSAQIDAFRDRLKSA